MSTDVIVPGYCDDLESCTVADFNCVPTMEFRIANLEFPLGRTDIGFLSTMPVNFFATDPLSTTTSKKFATSNAIAQNSFEINGNFILLGLGVVVQTEGMGMTIEGTWAGPQCKVTSNFASPSVLRNSDPGYKSQLGLANDVEVHPAEVDFGIAVWRAAHDLIYGYNLKVYSPDDSNVILIEEPVSEIGNCFGITDFDGFGAATHGVALIERLVNDRLSAMVKAKDTSSPYADGRFRAINSEQAAAVAQGPFTPGELVPTRYQAANAAFGRVRVNPSVQSWYRLPSPLPLVRGTLLRIEFQSDPGHIEYVNSMLRTAMIDLIEPWEGMDKSDVPTFENGVAGTQDGKKVYIPAGRMRLGIALKGFKVTENVCQSLATRIAGTGGESAKLLKALCAGKLTCAC